MNYSFKDSRGTVREIVVNFATIFRVAHITGYDLLNPASEQDGVVLSDRLLSEPQTLIKIIYAFCASDENEDSFYEAIDGAAFAEAENAFWNAYSDFFARAGRDWIVLAIAKSLETKRMAEKTVEESIRNLENLTSSVSSSSPEAQATGNKKQSGNSPASPTLASEKKRQTERKSSARSTTRTSRAVKTSEAPATSTHTSELKPKSKRRNS